MIAAMPIVLNLDSRGLSGFIIALYLIMDVFLITRKGENAVTIQKRKKYFENLNETMKCRNLSTEMATRVKTLTLTERMDM